VLNFDFIPYNKAEALTGKNLRRVELLLPPPSSSSVSAGAVATLARFFSPSVGEELSVSACSVVAVSSACFDLLKNVLEAALEAFDDAAAMPANAPTCKARSVNFFDFAVS